MVTVENYISMVSDPMPYETKWGALIDELKVCCPECEKETVNNKYRFNEFNHSLDIVAVGLCSGCSLVVTAKPFRIYDDGRFVYLRDDGEWVQVEWSFIQTILRKIKKLFRK